MSAKQTPVVIGNGMVGQHFLNGLMTSPAKELYEIVIFCEEPRPAYERVHLSEFFSGKSAEDLALADRYFFELMGVNVGSIGDAHAKTPGALGQVGKKYTLYTKITGGQRVDKLMEAA